MTLQEIALHILVAIFAGALIGTERQWLHRMAGLRTNALVSLGACLFVLLSVIVTGESSPTRIAAQVVSGIGFLGGGVIIRDGFSIRGLNTAATLWCSAAVGTLVGAGFLKVAILGAFGVLIANIFLRPVALFMNKKSTDQMPEKMSYVLSATCSNTDEVHIRLLLMQMLNTEDIELRELYSEEIEEGKKVTIHAVLHCNTKKTILIEKVVNGLRLEVGVTATGWKAIFEQEGD
ncbi:MULTISPECIES: MgtC/SapB family protein [unclassified Bacillus (in: firmicutes)]|uniref:MgtC/SapB family protein n=1 Tax=unclassified Bacillus (in: firmicutes) TaxID=185979 RepID=UPI00232C05E5|nr:MgtC/SapB family protein [Bacillus sp. BP-3]MDC2866484.1 MgtC/SapB family protein [Bacillus sp. BP-3]